MTDDRDVVLCGYLRMMRLLSTSLCDRAVRKIGVRCGSRLLSTADEMVPRWKDRLSGADLFTLPNAWAMAESLRLDLNSMGPFGIKA